MTLPFTLPKPANSNGTAAWVEYESYVYYHLYMMGWEIDLAVTTDVNSHAYEGSRYVRMIKPRKRL